jgi:hypothetical protein
VRALVLSAWIGFCTFVSPRAGAAQDPTVAFRRWSRTGEMFPAMRTVVPESLSTALLHPCSRRRWSNLDGYWTVSEVQLNEVEAQLAVGHAAAISRLPRTRTEGAALPRAADYYRYYAGVYRNGQPVIVVKALEQSLVDFMFSRIASQAIERGQSLPEQPWKQYILTSCDSQWNEFGALYDVGTATLGPIEFNGGFSGPLDRAVEKPRKPKRVMSKPPR